MTLTRLNSLGLSAQVLLSAAAASIAGALLWLLTPQAHAQPIGNYSGITSTFTTEFGAALVVGLSIFGTIAAVIVGIRIIKRMMS